jgi:putative inorganic carbon (hco3(-)) transporter
VPVRDILLIAVFVASLPVCFLRPFYGIALWTIVAFLNPHRFLWQAQSTFPWGESVAIATLLGTVLFVRGWKRMITRETILMLLLWVWFTVTSVQSSTTPAFYHHSQETWYRWEVVTKILLMSCVTVLIVDTFARLRKLLLVIAGCFGFLVLKSVPFIIMTGGQHRVYGPDASSIADNTSFGLALNMTLPLFFFLAHLEPRRWAKRLLWLLFVCTIPTIFFTYSRGALVGLVPTLGIMLLQSKRRFLLAPVIVMGALIAILFAPAHWQERMDPSREGALDGSALARLHAWQFALNLVADYPIAGGGFSTYTSELFTMYAPTLAGDDVVGSHSIYFQVLAEHGFVGLGLYLTLVLACIVRAFSLNRAARQRGDPMVAHYATMLYCSLVGFLVSGAFLGLAYFDYYFAIVACLAILSNVARTEWAAASADERDQGAEFDDETADLPDTGGRVWAS